MNTSLRTIGGTLLRVTGIRKVISFFSYIAFDGPGVVRLLGIGLMLVIGLTHMYKFPEHFQAEKYIGMCFAALFVGTLVSAFGIMLGHRRAWALGAVICGVAIVGYIISRTWALPSLSEYSGRWDEPAGTFAVATELLFLSLYASIITGINVAYPDKRNWHD